MNKKNYPGIYFIRHGRPAFPGGQKIYLGSTDLPLETQVPQCFSSLLEFVDPKDRVLIEKGDFLLFSSPLKRAIETAESIFTFDKIKDVPKLEILPDLREYDLGEWEGKTFDYIKDNFRDAYENRNGKIGTDGIPGAEKNEDALARFEKVINHIQNKCKSENKPGVIVGHTGVLELYLRARGGSRGLSLNSQVDGTGSFYKEKKEESSKLSYLEIIKLI